MTITLTRLKTNHWNEKLITTWPNLLRCPSLFEKLTNIFSLFHGEAFNLSCYLSMTELTVPLPVIRRLGRELLSAISQFLYTSYMEEFTMGCHKNSWKQKKFVGVLNIALTQDLNFIYIPVHVYIKFFFRNK